MYIFARAIAPRASASSFLVQKDAINGVTSMMTMRVIEFVEDDVEECVRLPDRQLVRSRLLFAVLSASRYALEVIKENLWELCKDRSFVKRHSKESAMYIDWSRE